MDSDNLCSSIMVAEQKLVFDLFHIYLIVMVHIRVACERFYKKPINELFDEIKYTLPVNPKKQHAEFMDAAIGAVFPKCPILQVTEPEAAFAYLVSKDLLDSKTLSEPDQKQNVLLIDGGDGTIDCIRLQNGEQIRGHQVWTYLNDENKSFCRYNIGGSKFKIAFCEKVENIFVVWNKNQIDKKQKTVFVNCINDFYKSYRDGLWAENNVMKVLLS